MALIRSLLIMIWLIFLSLRGIIRMIIEVVIILRKRKEKKRNEEQRY